MLTTHKNQIYSFFVLFFALTFSGFGQSESVNFLWNDQQNNERNASLALNWNHNKSLQQWELHITVKWLDTNGEIITNANNQPFIFLSEYDYEVISDEDISCLNFSVSERISDMQFQDKGVLRFTIPSELEAPGSVDIKFGYSLSESDIEDANIDPIKIPGQSELKIALPDTRIPEDDIKNIPNDPMDLEVPELSQESKDICHSIREKVDGLFLLRERSDRQLTIDDKDIGIIRTAIENVEPSDTVKEGQFKQALQSHFELANISIAGIDSSLLLIRGVRETLDNSDIPKDSSERYKAEILRLENDISSLRGEYVDTRVQIRRMLGDLGSSYADNQLAGMKKSLEDKYGDLFNMHVDTLNRIEVAYSTLEPDLNTEIYRGPRKAYKNEAFKGFRNTHNMLKSRLDSVKEGHQVAYMAYREEIEETLQIPSIETLNIRFDDIYGNLNGRLNNMELKISRLVASMNEQIIKPAPIGVIIGGSLFLFLVMVLLMILLSRRRNIRQTGTGIPTTLGAEIAGFSLIDDSLEESAEYYKMIIPSEQQDIMVSEVHFHLRVIKSIYHLTQGALLDKKPENFGGLMFGRQYKGNGMGNGNGDGKNIVIVERVVSAEQIRPDMAVGQENSYLLVDEIEKIVAANKKMALLGWFTSSAESDNEMPDSLVKIHRTYFREKWQLACLIYPGSDQMNSGIFIRRKSGYFDTVPSEGFRLSWDELYHFAVDPPSKKVLEEKKRPDSSVYMKVDLNQNWCDSIVEHLFIHPDVLNDISSEKENRIQRAASQKANGFLYGEVFKLLDKEGDKPRVELEIFISKFTLATSNENPRELPGSELLGWLRIDNEEIFETLKIAIPFHEEVFKSPFQVCALLNSNTSEIRFFSRKHNLEMNNNTIETEEYNLNSLIS